MRKILFAVCIILYLTFSNKTEVFGSEDSWWIYDEMGVVSEGTEVFVASLNEDIFPSYEMKPQLGMMIIEELPAGYTMDSFKLEMFNKLGVGTMEENCGMLFVLAINDREYGLEIGDGFIKGSVLREDLESDFITVDMKNLLRAYEYDAVIYQVAEHLGSIMKDEEDGVYVWKEQERILQRQERERREASIREQNLKVMRICAWIIIAATAGTAVLVVLAFLVWLVKRKRRCTFIRELADNNYRYICLTGKSSEDVIKYIKKEKRNFEEYSDEELGERLVKILYEYYLKIARSTLEAMEKKTSTEQYMNWLREVNSFEAFQNMNLQSVEEIVRVVDGERERKQRLLAENFGRIKTFVQYRNSEILEKGISLEIMEENLRKHCIYGEELTEENLNKAYSEVLKEFDFEKDFENFLKENKGKIDTNYLNKKELYKTMKDSDDYTNYSLHSTAWMLPWLVLHMQQNRQREEEHREYERRQEAYREASRRTENEDYGGPGTSFGTGFGGGFSSGGGFSGKW